MDFHGYRARPCSSSTHQQTMRIHQHPARGLLLQARRQCFCWHGGGAGVHARNRHEQATSGWHTPRTVRTSIQVCHAAGSELPCQPQGGAPGSQGGWTLRFQLCGLPFTYDSAISYLATRLSQYPDGATCSAGDAQLLEALLDFHPNPASKIGPGISHFAVSMSMHGTRCFHVHRVDGTSTDFRSVAARRCPRLLLHSMHAPCCYATEQP
jgi:hypothetical protein